MSNSKNNECQNFSFLLRLWNFLLCKLELVQVKKKNCFVRQKKKNELLVKIYYF